MDWAFPDRIWPTFRPGANSFEGIWQNFSKSLAPGAGKRRKVVGAEGFELSTYGTQNRRATRLRYAPTKDPIKGNQRIEKP